MKKIKYVLSYLFLTLSYFSLQGGINREEIEVKERNPGAELEDLFVDGGFLDKVVLEKMQDAIAEGFSEGPYKSGSIWIEHRLQRKNNDNFKISKELKTIAKLINSEHYYSELTEKNPSFNFYFKPQINLGEHLLEQRSSMVEAIVGNINFFNEPYLGYISIEDLRNELKFQLEKLSNYAIEINGEKHTLIFDLLHVMAIDAFKNPIDPITLTDSNVYGTDCGSFGAYKPFSNKIDIDISVLSKNFYGVLTHEMTHKLMQCLFQSTSPYKKTDQFGKTAFGATIEKINQSVDKISQSNDTPEKAKQTIRLWKSVNSSYEADEHHDEYIVKLTELMALDLYDDAIVKDLLNPLAEYWLNYIEPEIKRYIKENGKYNQFTSNHNHHNHLDNSRERWSQILMKRMQDIASNLTYREGILRSYVCWDGFADCVKAEVKGILNDLQNIDKQLVKKLLNEAPLLLKLFNEENETELIGNFLNN